MITAVALDSCTRTAVPSLATFTATVLDLVDGSGFYRVA
jgi:hypothetical protein